MTEVDDQDREFIGWGRRAGRSIQGSAIRDSRYDRRYWWCHWSGLFDTTERDGQMIYRKDGSQQSENGIFVTYPYAVVNDFGELVPVDTYPMLESWEQSRYQPRIGHCQ